MASKHLKPGHSLAHRLVALASVVVAFAAIAAALLVYAVDGDELPVQQATAPSPAAAQPLSQEGRLIAMTPSSVTAQSADGFARTYAITAETNAVTERGSIVGAAGSAFAVNDEVAIVGIVQDGTAIATAVVDKQLSNLNGPPMDAV